jgi:ketosteroid isomerase-like protein
MLRTISTGVLVSATLTACGATLASNSPSLDDEVIAAERAALDRWGKGDPGGFLSLYADEITYFDPFQERRIDGLPPLRALYEPLAGTFSIHRYEMLNPRVQRYGDVAVLTYNLQNYARQPDGTERPATRWNSTAVFRRIDGRWRTIHSHWSFTKPDLRNPPQ